MIDNVMAHPPPPPGPPPEEEAFRLEIYHFFRRSVRREDGGYVYARQYIYKSAWYLSELEACMVQAEIKTFLYKIGILGLIESFTYWRIQKLSHVLRAQGGATKGQREFNQTFGLCDGQQRGGLYQYQVEPSSLKRFKTF